LQTASQENGPTQGQDGGIEPGGRHQGHENEAQVEHHRGEGGQGEAAPGVENAPGQGYQGHEENVGKGNPGQAYGELEFVRIGAKAGGGNVNQ